MYVKRETKNTVYTAKTCPPMQYIENFRDVKIEKVTLENFDSCYFFLILLTTLILGTLKTCVGKLLTALGTRLIRLASAVITSTHNQNIDCGYTLEPPSQGGSNEYPQSMFWNKNKKIYVYLCMPQFYYIKVGYK